MHTQVVLFRKEWLINSSYFLDLPNLSIDDLRSIDSDRPSASAELRFRILRTHSEEIDHVQDLIADLAYPNCIKRVLQTRVLKRSGVSSLEKRQDLP